MTKSRKQAWIVAAVSSVSLVATLPASAQFQAQQDGRAHDANNRVGSGGFNESLPSGPRGTSVSPNDIIYRNVTGGKEFRGFLPERDPGAFTGVIPGARLDQFIRGSSGPPEPYQPSIDLGMPQPYFGQARGTAPPIGTVRLGFTGGYLGTDQLFNPGEGLTSEFNSALISQYAPPLGKSMILGTRTTFSGLEPAGTVLQGPLEGGNETLLTGSPLYGVRQWRAGETPSDTDALSAYGSLPSGLGSDRFRVDDQAIRQMRMELQGLAKPQPAQNPLNNDVQQNGNQQNNSLQQNLNNPIEAPQNNVIPPNGAPGSNGAALTSGALTSSVNTNAGTRQRVTSTILPGQISPQYGELADRLKRYQNPQMAQIEAAHQFQLDQRQMQTRQGVARGGVGTTQPAGGEIGTGAAPEPVKIKNIAEGVQAKGLRDTLDAAEKLTRAGKYNEAIDKFNLAEQVTPGNGLIMLGRANAELAAGFYAQAAADIRRTFLVDRKVLFAQYDLKSMLPPERLDFITRELQDLARDNPSQQRPAFLLAYIFYNTDQLDDARKWLAEAQKRSTGRDPVLELMKTHWRMTGGAKPEDLNK